MNLYIYLTELKENVTKLDVFDRCQPQYWRKSL